MLPLIEIGNRPLSVDDVVALARRRSMPTLSRDAAWRDRLARGPARLAHLIAQGTPVYGVTTGFGDSWRRSVSPDQQTRLAQDLVRFHGCGTGRLLDPEESAAVLCARLASLARGYSAVRPIVIERLCDLLTHGILPAIPAEGSVGASGDLTPLSYIAAVLTGEREVLGDGMGGAIAAREALAAAGLTPIDLRPKESLALMNGTSMMTGLACLGVARSHHLARWAAMMTAMTASATQGRKAHFDARIFELKPHAGTIEAGRLIRDALDPITLEPARLQDRYSLRCAPHVIGVLIDTERFARGLIETELNGVNDNPMLDPDTGDVLHGGNFYGGHVAMACDALKAAVASVADLIDRQIELLCNPHTNAGLPANLAAKTSDGVSHGYKAMQITASALTAEALQRTLPAASFSRSTECHNQDKVSMGSIAARDLQRICTLVESVIAIGLLAACEAIDHRALPISGPIEAIHTLIRARVPALIADRRQDIDIAAIRQLLTDPPPGADA